VNIPALSNKLPSWVLPVAGLIIIGLIGYSLWPKPKVVTYSGLIQAKEVKSASLFGGRVKQVNVQEGDLVQPGQVLVVFDDTDLRAQVSEARSILAQTQAKYQQVAQGMDPQDITSARATVRQAEEQVSLLRQGARPEDAATVRAKFKQAQTQATSAQEAYQNGQTLFASGVISQQKLDDLRSQASAAQSQLQAAQAQLSATTRGGRPQEIGIARAQLDAARAQLQKVQKGASRQDLIVAQAAVDQAKSALDALSAKLGEAQIKASITGTVTLVNVSPGETVSPNRPVLTLMDTQHLWTDIYLPESMLDAVQIGQSVKVVADAMPKSTFSGMIKFINPKSEFVPRGVNKTSDDEASFRVKVDVAPQSTDTKRDLLPGMTVKVTFTLGQG
jgi:HlyD family secretion protein